MTCRGAQFVPKLASATYKTSDPHLNHPGFSFIMFFLPRLLNLRLTHTWAFSHDDSSHTISRKIQRQDSTDLELLINAIIDHQKDTLEDLIDLDEINIDEQDQEGYTALHYSIMEGWSEGSLCLLENKASCFSGSSNRDVLYLAIKYEDLEVIHWILTNNPHCLKLEEYMRLALILAVDQRAMRSISLLFAYGISLHPTIFSKACLKSDIPILEMLLQYEISSHMPNFSLEESIEIYGVMRDMFYDAIKNQNKEIIYWGLSKKNIFLHIEKSLEEAFVLGREKHTEQIINFLRGVLEGLEKKEILHRRGDKNSALLKLKKYYQSIFSLTVEQEDEEYLLDYGVIISSKTLCKAWEKGNTLILELLLNHAPFSVEEWFNGENNPILYAAKKGKWEALKIILAKDGVFEKLLGKPRFFDGLQLSDSSKNQIEYILAAIIKQREPVANEGYLEAFRESFWDIGASLTILSLTSFEGESSFLPLWGSQIKEGVGIGITSLFLGRAATRLFLYFHIDAKFQFYYPQVFP